MWHYVCIILICDFLFESYVRAMRELLTNCTSYLFPCNKVSQNLVTLNQWPFQYLWMGSGRPGSSAHCGVAWVHLSFQMTAELVLEVLYFRRLTERLVSAPDVSPVWQYQELWSVWDFTQLVCKQVILSHFN